MKYIRTHLIKQLVQSEGLRLEVYQDTLGIDTIGVGRNLEDRGITKEELEALDFPNIEAVYEHGITEADAAYLLENDVQIVEEELLKAHPCVADLDAVRQLVLVDMAFNMGVPRLCKFKKIYEVCRLTPSKRHWLPTREAWIKDHLQEKPNNLVIRFSAPMVNQRAPQSWPNSSEVVTEGGNCPSSKQGNQCLDCRACWDPSIKTIQYKAH